MTTSYQQNLFTKRYLRDILMAATSFAYQIVQSHGRQFNVQNVHSCPVYKVPILAILQSRQCRHNIVLNVRCRYRFVVLSTSLTLMISLSRQCKHDSVQLCRYRFIYMSTSLTLTISSSRK